MEPPAPPGRQADAREVAEEAARPGGLSFWGFGIEGLGVKGFRV